MGFAEESQYLYTIFPNASMLMIAYPFIIEGALEELGVYAKCIYNTLRKLKRNSVAVTDILKALMNLPSINAVNSGP